MTHLLGQLPAQGWKIARGSSTHSAEAREGRILLRLAKVDAHSQWHLWPTN